MITFNHDGSFNNIESFLKSMSKFDATSILNRHGQRGVDALASATPKDSGVAASSWGYEVITTRGRTTITWTNSNVENGFPVVIMLQYGHGTGTGGYVQGRDFINPAIKPIFDEIANDVWKAVTSA